MSPYTLPPLDRRCHESIRMAARLIALQVRQGYFPKEHGEHLATEVGVSAEVLNRELGAKQ